ncbi:3'-5' exonuclease [Kingella negevensis]|uniref:3'-5' exonuclease n=1 Tax=Kingella negevensis TaxID=1522312 RepID=UPI0025429240|nr:3'-5' exonuclease [Kingella negevensis]WII92630.1 3'-5' exonuclease [Kingella negevensis]
MATFIPSFNQLEEHLDNQEEIRVARFLNKHLGNDCLVWCNIPTGNKSRYADFLVLMPNTGLLCLEVKGWSSKAIQKIDKCHFQLKFKDTDVGIKNPMEQARECAHNVVNDLAKDPILQQKTGDYVGKLVFPYAYGVVYANITRNEIQAQMGENYTVFDAVSPLRHTMYKNDLTSSTSQGVRNRLAAMFEQRFPCKLDKEQIDRIRWHLFPEIRISTPVQQDLFAPTETQPEKIQDIKLMDLKQEQIARQLGGGHRIIHGVAGSGKTLILGLRSKVLSKRTQKPVLVLCYNISLATKLRHIIAERGVSERVEVHHFHEWCGELVKKHGLVVTEEERQFKYDFNIQAALRGVETGEIPTGQYGAILIDEGHDFKAEWLSFTVKMLDKLDNHLLLLYDDAQSIYHNRAVEKGIKFSLSSVGIEALGRTIKLHNNYRNTKQIIGLAHIFAQQNLLAKDSDDDNIPVLEPNATGMDGENPCLKTCGSWEEELKILERCLKKWADTMPLNQIAVICPWTKQCDDVCDKLGDMGLDYWALQNKNTRKTYDPKQNKISVLTIKSSKGLEFPRVVMMGMDKLAEHSDEDNPTRLIYVAMTRAQTHLVITLSGCNSVTEHIQASFEQYKKSQAA